MGFRDLGRRAFITFLLLSLVSLFADMTYEGARSVFGSYLSVLGATALLAGLASIGEFLGYVMRLVSGIVAGHLRSSRGYWGLVFMGYILNLIAVPLLAFSGHWLVAILLIFIERMGKGLRTPARDVILAEVTEKIGRGKAFGFHEALDQAGAVLGPSIVSIALYTSNMNYMPAFLILAIPAILSITALSLAYVKYPEIKAVHKAVPFLKSGSKLNDVFWCYTLSMSLVALGFMHWINVSYYLKAGGSMPDYLIALMYLVAMLVDGLFAFPIGLLYDRAGFTSLLLTPILAVIITPTVLMGSFNSAVVASVSWGAVMGIFESTARAAIADIVPVEGQAYGYGIFGAAYGVSWMAGSVIYGWLYPSFINFMIPYTVIVEAAAFLILLISVRRFRRSHREHR